MIIKYKNRLYAAVVSIGAVFLSLVIACSGISVETYYNNGAVASVSPIASDIGIHVMEKEGGNAFDAAIAVAFTLAVVYPESGNIGGGGFAVIRDGKTKEITSLDFRETAPHLATDTMYLDEQGEVIGGLSTLGAKAVGVPGTVAGMYELWEQKGSLPWDQLVGYAAALADTGFVVNKELAESLRDARGKLTTYPDASGIFYPDGGNLSEGDTFVQEELSRALYLIAAEGASAFYSGEIADSLVSVMDSTGGLITREDLLAYTPTWRDPLSFTFDSLTIFSMAPPSSGGVALAQILKILERFDFTLYQPSSPEYIHLFTEASRFAFADRSDFLGDPEYFTVPVDQLLDSAYLAECRSLIEPESALNTSDIKPETQPSLPSESDQTTHVSICDDDGNIVSMTYTLNTSYGSKLTVPGFGFLLNNEMDDFSVKPGVPNTYGLIGGEANKIEPGKRMLSSMSPTIVMQRDRPVMVVGSPGGSKIITAVAQTILNVSRFHLLGKDAVSHPRFHHQWVPNILYLEQGGYSINVTQELIRYGHSVQERDPYGDVQLLLINSTGLITGASDPRHDGRVSGY